MKQHFCPAEQSIITYQGKCNWCGEQEALAQTQEPPFSVQQAYAMAQVCLDIHAELGCAWGDNVYLTISQLKAFPSQRTEQNFCSRCGKRTNDLTTIHTCTPPQD